MPEFTDVVLSAGKQKKRGTLSWPPLVPSQPAPALQFTAKTVAAKPVIISPADIIAYNALLQSDGYMWRLTLKAGTVVRFSGLSPNAIGDIERYVNANNTTLTKEVVSTKGTNAGHFKVTDQSVMFTVNGQTAFDLPMHLIQQAVAQSKNEVALELLHDDHPANKNAESLYEVRLFVPDIVDPSAMDTMNAEGEHDTAAQLFAKELMAKGDIGEQSSKSIATFEKLLFAVPRGRYDVALYSTFLKLQSQTYTYKISYKNINKMFLFDRSDSNNHIFVIGLHPPVRQGRTAYPYLVVPFDSQNMVEQSFPITEKESEEKYQNLLKPVMKGPMHDVVTRVFKALTKKKVLIPGQSFVSHDGSASVSCSYKANEGHLFFLEKSFFFLKKPPMHIRHAEVISVEIAHLSNANKRFGMTITTTEAKGNSYVFTNINRDEYDGIINFLKAKGLNVVTGGVEDGSKPRQVDYSEDPYMKQLEADRDDDDEEGGGGRESDSENDEDFVAESASDESSDDSAESEVEDDNDESDDSDKPPTRKKKAKKSKPAAKGPAADKPAGKKKKKVKAKESESESESGSGSSDDGGKKQRKKKVVDPNAPKKPLSAYLLYLGDARPKLLVDEPTLTFAERAKKLANQWNNLDPDIKAQYNQRHYDEDKIYNKLKAEYDEKHGTSSKKKKRPVREEAIVSDDEAKEPEAKESTDKNDDDDVIMIDEKPAATSTNSKPKGDGKVSSFFKPIGKSGTGSNNARNEEKE